MRSQILKKSSPQNSWAFNAYIFESLHVAIENSNLTTPTATFCKKRNLSGKPAEVYNCRTRQRQAFVSVME